MSDELDNKLEDVLKKGIRVAQGGDKIFFTFDGITQEIEQAFKDAGWIKVMPANTTDEEFKNEGMLNGTAIKIQHGYLTEAEWEAKAIKDGWIHVTASQETQAAIANTMLGNKVMAGQAWYDKFEKELKDKLYGEQTPTIDCDGCSCDALDAAKKASGIS